MLRQIEGVVQYEPMEVQRLSFASYYFIFYKKFYLSVETLLKSWLDETTIQMLMAILFVSDGALFEGAFFPVSILNNNGNGEIDPKQLFPVHFAKRFSQNASMWLL